MGEFSLSHLLLVALIVLIFFGPSRLPALGQSLGRAIRSFKQGLHEIETEVHSEVHPEAPSGSNPSIREIPSASTQRRDKQEEHHLHTS